MMALLPLVVAAFMALLFGLSLLFPVFVKRVLATNHVGWLLWRSYMSFLTVAHSFISWKMFGAFVWQGDRLNDFLEISWDSERAHTMVAVAVVVVVVYTIGYPLFLTYHLYRTNWGKMIGPTNKETNLWLGNLVQDFEVGRRHLVLVDIGLKLALVIVLRFADPVQVQIALFTVFLVLYFLLQLVFSPYRVDVQDSQRDVNQAHVASTRGAIVRQRGFRQSARDGSLCEYLCVRFTTMQMKDQASLVMFGLSVIIIMLGLISIQANGSDVLGVMMLIVMGLMLFTSVYFALHAFVAAKKKHQLEDVGMHQRELSANSSRFSVPAGDPPEMESNSIYEAEISQSRNTSVCDLNAPHPPHRDETLGEEEEEEEEQQQERKSTGIFGKSPEVASSSRISVNTVDTIPEDP